MSHKKNATSLIFFFITNHNSIKCIHSQGNEIGETLSRFAGELRMPQHGSAHRKMVIYADLMLWLKSNNPIVFDKLSTVYMENLSRLYTREVADFLESARQRLLSKETKGKHSKAL